MNAQWMNQRRGAQEMVRSIGTFEEVANRYAQDGEGLASATQSQALAMAERMRNSALALHGLVRELEETVTSFDLGDPPRGGESQ